MANTARWTLHGPGILSKIRARDGAEIYYAQVRWNGKRFTEKAGTTFKQAAKLLGTRQNEADNGTYIPPKDRKRAERKASTDREALRFDRAAAAFVATCGGEYARKSDVDSLVKHLKIYFGSMYLDEIKRADLDAYTVARLGHLAPFPKGGRKTGLRSPQRETAMLSQVIGFMQDGGHRIPNPCIRQRGQGRRSKCKAATYTPERVAVVPSDEIIGAILAKAPKAAHRALFALAFYTGGRPESDLLRLRHGDVEVPEGNVKGLDGKPVLGWVHFRDAKTDAGNRSIPLHPEAAKALAPLLLPEPQGKAERKAWAETPIFRTRTRKGAERNWNRTSYVKAWQTAIKGIDAAEGMILRDLRKVFRTRLTDARIPEPTIQILMGHKLGVSFSYYKPDTVQLRDAILSLGVVTGVVVSPAHAVNA